MSDEYYYDEDNDIRTNKPVLAAGIVELPRRETEEKPFGKIKEKCKQNNIRLITEMIMSDNQQLK